MIVISIIDYNILYKTQNRQVVDVIFRSDSILFDTLEETIKLVNVATDSTLNKNIYARQQTYNIDLSNYF